MSSLKDRLHRLLRASERYTATDMVYMAESGLWLTLGTITISLCSLVLYIVFARVLPKEVYGTYQFFLSVAAIIGSLGLTGMNSAVARAVARGYEGTFRMAVRAQLRWGLLPFLIALALAGYYALHGNATLAVGLVVIGVFAPLVNALNTYAAFLQGKREFRRGYLYGLIWNLPFYGVLIVCAFLFPGALVLLTANLLVQVVMLFVVYRRTLRTFKPNDEVDPDALAYGRHLTVMNVIGMVNAQIDLVLAFHFLGAAQTAVYSFATAVPERLSGLFKFLPTAALPKLSEKSPAGIRMAFGKRIWWVALAMAVLTALYALAAPALFAFLFPAYTEAVPYSQLYGLMIVASLSGLFTTALTAGRNVKELYVFNILSPTFQILLQLAGVIVWGLWGLIIARLGAQFLSLLLALVLLFRKPPSAP